jgi:serine/threonine protein kinase/TolA-binding protein
LERNDDIQFGQLAILLGFASPSAVSDCLNYQRLKRDEGEERHVSDILVEKGILTPSQVKQILIRQGKTLLVCRSCAVRYNLTDSLTAENLFRCPACGRPLDPASPKELVGERETGVLAEEVIGGCKIDTLLFEDSTTYAYKAWQTCASRDVVVRVLKGKLAKDKEFAKRFLYEAALAARLRHPGIISIYDVGKSGTLFYICHAYVEGTALEKLLAIDKRFPVREAVKTALSIARALAHTHEQGVIHGNLTPANIIFTKQGQIVVSEIGIPKRVVETAEAGLAASGLLIGSPEFMAPEQIEDYSMSGVRSDIFALGAILYKMIAGQSLFVGDNPVEILASNLEGRHRRLQDVVPDVPEELARIVEKMVSRSPNDRHYSLQEVITELEALDLCRVSQLRTAPVARAPAPSGIQEELRPREEPVETEEKAEVKKEKPRISEKISAFISLREKQVAPKIEISPEEKEEIVKEALQEPVSQIGALSAELPEEPGVKRPSRRGLIFLVVGLVAVLLVAIFIVALLKRPPEEQMKGPAEVAFSRALEYAKSNPENFKEQLKYYREAYETYPGTEWARNAKTKMAHIEAEMREAAVDTAWQDILNFLKENPAQMNTAQDRLRKFIESYPESFYTKEAKEKIAQIEVEKSKQRTEALWNQISSQVGELRTQRKFGEAIELLEKKLPPQLARAAYEQAISSLKDEVYLQADKAYREIEEQATKLTLEGRYEEAVQKFEDVIANFGLPDYLEKAKRGRAEALNAKKEKVIYLKLEALSACEDAFLLAQKENYSEAEALLEGTLSRKAPSDASRIYLTATLECLKASRDYNRRALDRIKSLIGTKVSLKSQAGITHEGILTKFEGEQLYIGEMPPLPAQSLSVEEIMKLSDASPLPEAKKQQLARASYLYFQGMIEEASEVLAESENDLLEAGVLGEAVKSRLFSQAADRAVILFDGQKMDAWQIVKGEWKVEDGAIVAQKAGSLQLKTAPRGKILLKFRARFAKNCTLAISFSISNMDFTLGLAAGEAGSASLEGVPETQKAVSLEEFEWYSFQLRAGKEQISLSLDDQLVFETDTPQVEPSRKPAGILFDLRGGRVELKDITLITARE